MCYDDNARPPVPNGDSGAANGEDIVLTAADGNKFSAFIATPENPANAQILIYPDVRGLHQFYKDLALRFAGIGFRALAIDYFGRTAGLTSRDESFEFMPHVQQIKFASFLEDVTAGLSYLRDDANIHKPVFVVGFCMGGSLTLLSGTNKEFGFGGLVPFYAGMTRDFGGAGTVLDNAEKISYPVLGLFGGNDPGIPETAVRTLEEKLDATGVENKIIIYPDAPHSFFDRRATDFADASADAWIQIQDFIATHSNS